MDNLMQPSGPVASPGRKEDEMSYFNEDQRGVESWEAEKTRTIVTLRAALEAADEVANDLGWALAWLENEWCGSDPCWERSQTLSDAKGRLLAYRTARREVGP